MHSYFYAGWTGLIALHRLVLGQVHTGLISTPFTPRIQVRPGIMNTGQSQVRPGFRPCSYSRNIPGNWPDRCRSGLSVNNATWVASIYPDAWPGTNPVRYPGNFFGTRSLRSWPGPNPGYSLGVKGGIGGVFHFLAKHSGFYRRKGRPRFRVQLIHHVPTTLARLLPMALWWSLSGYLFYGVPTDICDGGRKRDVNKALDGACYGSGSWTDTKITSKILSKIF